MESYQANDFTIAELREVLREKGISTGGTKVELVRRLKENDPAAWERLCEQRGRAARSDGAATLVDVHVAGEWDDAAGGAETGGNAPRREDQASALASRSEDSDDAMQRELALLRRERAILEREQQLLRREVEIMRSASTMTATTNGSTISAFGGVRGIKELLPEFDAADGTFWRWKQQLELLRRTYQLDENSTKVLIGFRLKGRALSWFYSKAEYVTLNLEDFLREMELMFDLRPGKLSLRREFESRVWRGDEPFCDYYHEKVILANRIPIAEDELLDYVIEGVTDPRLQNQARLMNFRSGTELLKAFEKIQMNHRRIDTRPRKEGARMTGGGRIETSTRGKQTKCFRCHEMGHIATQCKRSPVKRACYSCGSPRHLARECPKQNRSAAAEMSNDSVRIASANVVQSAVLLKPYMFVVKVVARNESGGTDSYVLDAMIDSGSPISLIKDEIVRGDSRLLADENVDQFCGINGSRLRINGVVYADLDVKGVRVRIKFYTVPHDTMAYNALLGRDFLSHPSLRVTLGKDLEIVNAEEARVVHQMMHIEYGDGLVRSHDELRINPVVGEDAAAKIHRIYESCYLNNLRAEKRVPDFEMIIALKHEQPISMRPRRLSFADKEALRKILDDLLEKTIIRPSNSPYASPIVLAKKKDNSFRLCIDYRELNKITIRDNFPTELIDDNIDRLRDKRYFTILDLKDGFHHVKMHEASVKFTSFVTPLGQYEYLRMPFGLMNAPRVFQRYIHAVFEPLVRGNKIILYLDDLLVATEDVNEHIEVLSEVFEIAGKHHLQFRLDKCCFAQTEIRYLGYCVSGHGIRPSDENIESVLNYPIPRNAKDVHRFVGLASYFRRFIPNFSVLAKPLYELIKKNAVFKFSSEENAVFEALKERLSSKPILAIYSPRAETELHCDASASGFGGILLQKQNDNTWRPISFWSQRTTPTESRYHSFELECLAVVYALKRFHIYLAGRRFRIITDCDSFRLTLSKKDINPQISRWALFLQNYDYEIVHRPGKRMAHVDALSRCHSVLVLEGSTLERTLSVCQDRDEEILKIRSELETGDVKQYELRDGLVYRKDKNKKLLFYIPRLMEANVIRTCHDDLGHVGIDKVINNIAKVYWFPRMRDKVREYINNCLKCIEFSPPSGKAEGYLHNIPKENLPFATIHIDHMGPLEQTGKGYRHLLVIIDAFTKFIRLYPCKSRTTEESIKHLCEYFRAYSKPKRLISDRGTCFTSDAFKKYLKSNNIEHILVAVSTPRANGQVERFNRIITPMLAKSSETPCKWDRALERVEYSLNNTVCRATGETPARLLFGVEQRGDSNDSLRSLINLNDNPERDLDLWREKAQANISETQHKNEIRYNLRRKPAREYKVGDYVEIRNTETTPGINKKLIPRFKGPYVIKKVLDRDRYVITDIEGFQLTQRPYTGISAPDQMRPYIH